MRRMLLALTAVAVMVALLAGALAEGLVNEEFPGDEASAELEALLVEAEAEEVETSLMAPEEEEWNEDLGDDDDGDDDDDVDIVYEGEDPVVQIEAEYFPDDIFRDYIAKTFDKNNDGWLSEKEVDDAEIVNIDNLGVVTLEGIEYLTALRSFTCTNNQLGKLDLRANEDVEYLDCRNCSLTELTLNDTYILETLYCGSNPLTTLDLSGQDALLALNCNVTELTKLDVGDCASLITLSANDCPKLAEVALKGAGSLLSLKLNNCALTALTLSDTPDLKVLSTVGSVIGSLDLAKCPELLAAAKNGALGCDGTGVSFGESLTVETDAGKVSGKPLSIHPTTNLTNGKETLYAPKFSLSDSDVSITAGKTQTVKAVFEPKELSGLGSVSWASDDEACATVSDGVVTGVAKGSANVTATSPWGATATVKVTVAANQEAPGPKSVIGKKVTKSRVVYEIISKSSAAVVGTTQDGKKLKTLKIAKYVYYGGITYTVTTIRNKAFKDCKKLRTLKIMGTKLTKVSQNAFSGLQKKKITVKVNKKMSKKTFKKLKKALKKAGIKTKKIKKAKM